MLPLIYIVDDEQDIIDLISLHLEKFNFRVQGFLDATSFFQQLGKTFPELIILDLMLPDESGFEVCKYLKKEDKYKNIPIIILSARAEETDKILGLELGADDYVTKPFSPGELVARAKAVLRRKDIQSSEKKLFIGDNILMDLDKYQVYIDGNEITLTSTEFKILKLFASKPGWVYTREQMLDYLWGDEKAVLDRTIDVHVKNLREKLRNSGKLIKNVRGVGYKLEL